MNDLISRKAAIKGKITIQLANGVEIYSDEAVPVGYLKALPPAQPECVEGEWILYDKRFPWRTWYKCSNCGNYLDFSGVNGGRGEVKFCPNCGAKMKGERT